MVTGGSDCFISNSRAGRRRYGAQLGTILVGPGSQSTCTKVCRIGCGAQLGAIGPIGLRPALCNSSTYSGTRPDTVFLNVCVCLSLYVHVYIYFIMLCILFQGL